jgi:hypothetical protein
MPARELHGFQGLCQRLGGCRLNTLENARSGQGFVHLGCLLIEKRRRTSLPRIVSPITFRVSLGRAGEIARRLAAGASVPGTISLERGA